MNLGLAQDSEEDNPRGGVYFTFEFGMQAFDSKLDFVINEEITGHFSIDPDISFFSPGLGYSQTLGDRINVRYQGNILGRGFYFGNLIYDDVVAEHSAEGNLNATGATA